MKTSSSHTFRQLQVIFKCAVWGAWREEGKDGRQACRHSAAACGWAQILFYFFNQYRDFKVLVEGCERTLPRVSTSPHRLSSVASVCFSGLLALILRTPAGCLGLFLPCSRAPPLLCLSAWTPTGLKFSWRSTRSAISAWLCPFLSFSFFPSFPPLPPPLHFISHEATHPSASRYSWRRLWMCLAASHHPSRLHTDADGHRGWRAKKTCQSRQISIQKRALIASLFSRRWKELKGQHSWRDHYLTTKNLKALGLLILLHMPDLSVSLNLEII